MSRTRSQLDGALAIHKPIGPTSHDVVISARRSLGVQRIGHTGTLDPQASGVLLLVLGQATRLAQHLMTTDKEYVATVRFGVVTDTHDASGAVVHQSGLIPGASDVIAALERFRGTFEQIPPLYSAKMVGGERSYVRARAGKPVRPPATLVTAHEVALLRLEGAHAELRIRCSAGFYVRSLAHDLGAAVGTGAILDSLVRTETAGVTLADALPFALLVTQPRDTLRARVTPIERLLSDLPSAILTAEGLAWSRHGRDIGPGQLLEPLASIPPLVRLIAGDGTVVGLGEPSKMPGFLHPAVIFSYN